MILCPVQNTAILSLKKDWVQLRPRVTQGFGENPSLYAPFGLKAHNGLDIGVEVGTPLFAPMDGEMIVKNSGRKGYGLHVRIRNKYGREIVLGHFSEVNESKYGKVVYMGDYIGKSGNTGFSTGPHLHIGYRRLNVDDSKNIWQWTVKDYNNGYFGYIDIDKYIITGKGTLFSKDWANV